MLQRDVLIRVKNLPDDTNASLKKLEDNKASKATANSDADGLLSTELYDKLMGIPANANYYEHPTSHPASMITGLQTVATSGKYADLVDAPTSIGYFTNDAGYAKRDELHSHGNKGILDGITQPDIDNWNDKSWGSLTEVPDTLIYQNSNIGLLNNNVGYVTKNQVDTMISDLNTDISEIHSHSNLTTLNDVTPANWAAKLIVKKKSIAASAWTQDSDGLFSAKLTHNLSSEIQDVVVRNDKGEKVFVDFTNAADNMSITITTTQAYAADVELIYGTPIAIA